MKQPPDKLRPEEVVSKLSDRELLRNYCTFAGLHRAVLAGVLWDALSDDIQRRRTIAVEIAANFAAALEDVAMWFFILLKWKKGEGLLFDLLDSTQVRESPGSEFSTESAVTQMENWTIADLRREYGLPSDDALLATGWTEPALRRHIGALREALGRLQAALETRLMDEGIVRTTYNKIKHGVMAVATSEHSTLGASVMIASRSGPKLPNGRRKINAAWIPCEDAELQKLVYTTLAICEAHFTILNLVYTSRFDQNWKPTEWPRQLQMDPPQA